MRAPSAALAQSTHVTQPAAPALRTPIIALMAIAAGLCAGGNYFNQPLLDSIASALHVSPATAAVSVTVAQVSYAIGLLLLVPLGDLLDRRKLAVALMVLAGVGQAVSGFAPTYVVLVIGIAVAGLFSVAAQVLVPYGASLAEPEKIGAVVGTIMSGLMVGILTARSLAGLLSALGGWTTIYRISAVLVFIVAIALWFGLPRDTRGAEGRISYGTALSSMGSLIVRHPRLLTRSLLGATAFAALSTIFSTMALLLAGDGFGFSDAQIGLVGLLGVVGALAANVFGRLADRGLGQWASAIAAFVMLVCWPIFGLGAHSVIWFGLGFVLADLALQGIHISNQNVVFGLDAAARSRMNSVYMTTYFIGAAAGSAIGSWAWQRDGWAGVCWAGAALALVAAVVLVADVLVVRHERRTNALDAEWRLDL